MTVPPGQPGRLPLDGPPPAPQPVPTGQTPGSGFGGIGGGASQRDAQDQMKGLAEAAQTVDQVLLTFAQSLPQGSKEFGAARQLIEQGLAKGLAAIGSDPEISTTEAGNQFPGGGFGSVGATGT